MGAPALGEPLRTRGGAADMRERPGDLSHPRAAGKNSFRCLGDSIIGRTLVPPHGGAGRTADACCARRVAILTGAADVKGGEQAAQADSNRGECGGSGPRVAAGGETDAGARGETGDPGVGGATDAHHDLGRRSVYLVSNGGTLCVTAHGASPAPPSAHAAPAARARPARRCSWASVKRW